MSERFFIATPIAGDRATLEGAEAHHLARVMRAAVGDAVTLFDGSGAQFDAQVTAIGKSAVELAVLARREVDCESPSRLTLAVALPKGDRQRWLVEKAVELGVAAIVPLVTSRGVAQPSSSALDRLRRTVVEASKQCGRNRLLEIGPAADWREFVRTAPRDSMQLLADPAGKPLRDLLPAGGANMPSHILAAVGPEGGFTEDEVAAAIAADWIPVNLGSRILRVETAAIAIAAWVA